MQTGRSGIQYQKIVDLDGHEYKIHSLVPSKAFKLGARLAKVVGEPVAAIAGAAGNEGATSEFFQKAMRALQQNLDEEAVWALIRDLLCCVEYNSAMLTAGTIETHFQGQLGHLFMLLTEVVKFQFSDFFSEIGKAIGMGQKGTTLAALA